MEARQGAEGGRCTTGKPKEKRRGGCVTGSQRGRRVVRSLTQSRVRAVPNTKPV
jgi:hypothetical protein